MKIVWCVNSIFPEMAKHLGIRPDNGTGSWMKMLCTCMSMNDGRELSIINLGAIYKKNECVKIGNIVYYGVAQTLFCQLFGASENDLKKIRELIKSINPDIIHIFGTEQAYALATKELSIPTIIRMQGILNCYLKNFFNGISILKRIRYLWLMLIWLSYRNRASIEKKIINENDFFECQSDWDFAWVKLYNSKAVCYRNLPILRHEFRKKKWAINNTKPYTVVLIGSEFPYKGVHIMLEAFNILVKKYPNAILKIIGSYNRRGYWNLITKLINNYKLDKNVSMTGYLVAEDICNEFLSNRVFVNPSFIENESLARLEAMAIGIPTVSAYSGGMPSVGSFKSVGLFFPAGDYALLAHYIEKLWLNNEFAEEVSHQQLEYMQNQQFEDNNIVIKTIEMYNSVINSYISKEEQ